MVPSLPDGLMFALEGASQTFNSEPRGFNFMKTLLLFLALTSMSPSFSKSLSDELSDVYLSSEKGFEQILEMYEIPVMPDSLIVRERSHYVQPSSGFFMETLVLEGASTPFFKIHIRHPQGSMTDKPLPVVFIAAGLYSSELTLNLLPRVENIVFVVYEYPINTADIFSILRNLDQSLKSIPGQMAASLNWLAAQPWVDPREIHTMNISLGSLFAPLAQRVAERQGTQVRSTILAYGGTDLSLIIDRELQGRLGHREREIAVDTLGFALKAFDPTLHLPYLKGQTLIVYGEDDSLIPKKMTSQMVEMTPHPKQVVALPGGHINTDKWDIIRAFGQTVIEWYKGLGVGI